MWPLWHMSPQLGVENTGGDSAHTCTHNIFHNLHSCKAFPQCVFEDVCSESFSGRSFCHSPDSCKASPLSARAGEASGMFSVQTSCHRRSSWTASRQNAALCGLLNCSNNWIFFHKTSTQTVLSALTVSAETCALWLHPCVHGLWSQSWWGTGKLSDNLCCQPKHSSSRPLSTYP